MEMQRLFCAEKGTAIWKEGIGLDLLKRRGRMKRDKFKKMRLQLEVLKPAKAGGNPGL